MLSDRQHQIIMEAVKLIAQRGIQGFTIKNLSHEIGISEPAIYRHFKSKTEILFVILNQFSEFKRKMSENVSDSHKPAIQKIQFIFDKLLTKFTENPSLVSVIFADEIFKNEKILSDKISQIMEANQEMFTLIIEQGQKNSEIRTDIDVKYIVLMAMGALRLLVKKWEMSKYNFNLNKEGEKLFRALKVSIKTNKEYIFAL